MMPFTFTNTKPGIVHRRLGRVIEQTKKTQKLFFLLYSSRLGRFKVTVTTASVTLAGRTTVDWLPADLPAFHVDTVARLGGDEFVILLDDIKDIKDAAPIAGRIQRLLPFNLRRIWYLLQPALVLL